MAELSLRVMDSLQEGIFQSGSMIFGDQANVKACTLMPSRRPRRYSQRKMEEAIAGFENQDEVLFLVDLWGGTPFNQASALLVDMKISGQLSLV